MFGKRPKPKQESESSCPEAFEWADRVNKIKRYSDERWQIWRQAYQSGIVLDVNPNLKFPGKPGDPDFYPAGALDDYLLHNPDE